MKKLLVLLIAVALFTACGNKKDDVDENAPIKIGELLENAGDLVDSVVFIEGKVDHICVNSKKKINLVCADNPDHSIKIFAGEELGDFDTTLVDQIVIVEGIVQEDRITSEELDEMEAKILAKRAIADSLAALEPETDDVEKTDEEGDEGCETEKGTGEGAGEGKLEAHHHDPLELIAEYRLQMEETQLDYVSIYSVIVNKIEVKAAEEVEEEVVEEEE